MSSLMSLQALFCRQGVSLLALGEFDKAERSLVQARKLEPNNRLVEERSLVQAGKLEPINRLIGTFLGMMPSL